MSPSRVYENSHQGESGVVSAALGQLIGMTEWRATEPEESDE